MSTPTSTLLHTELAAEAAMKKPLTLIVATTPSLGIGHSGSLPWPKLKGEMAYFARVTKRVQPSVNASPFARNAVIMGRKTWESIPERFRPLKGRVNCVVSRSAQEHPEMMNNEKSSGDVLFVRSFEDALNALRDSDEDAMNGHGVNNEHKSEQAIKEADNAAVPLPYSTGLQALGPIASIFIIGGASIYEAALKQQQRPVRVLLTKIREPEFECDTFFPVDLDSEEARNAGWERKSRGRLEQVVGESFEDEGVVKKEGDVEYEFCMYEYGKEY